MTITLCLLYTSEGNAGIYVQKKKSAYMWLLKECNQEVFKKTFEYPFLALLDKNLKKKYENLKSLDVKKSFIHYYWKEHNPNPLFTENEYLQDFIKRCNYVKEHFSYSEPPYFDDRGTYYLKYGEPSFRYTQAPQTRFVDFFREEIFMGEGSIGVRKFLASMIGKGVEAHQYLPSTYSIQGNETWVYQFIKEGKEEELVLHFVKQGDFFREVESLEDAIIHPRKMKIRFFYWADLLKERATALQSQSVFRAYESILNFEEEIRSVGDKGEYYALYSSATDIMNPDKKFMGFNNDLKVTLTNNKLDVPPIVFTSKGSVQELFFHYDIVQFRGPQDETTLTINYFTPLSDNFADNSLIQKQDTIYLQYGCLFEDQMLERVIESNCENKYDLQKLTGLNLPYLIGNMKMSLLPREGRISLQVKDEATQRKGFVKRNIFLRDFSAPELCISDIQFCQLIEDSLYKEFYPIIQKRGISVIPYPYESIKRSDQLFCYFEIYNIKTGGIQSQYEISIEVTTAKQETGLLEKAVGVFRKSQQNSVSIEHTRDVEQDESQELVGIDFSNLIQGNYTLTIGVSDKDNQSISAEVTRNLQIKD